MMEPTDITEMVKMLRNDVRELRSRIDELEVRVGKTPQKPTPLDVDVYRPNKAPPDNNDSGNRWNDWNLPTDKQIVTYERYVGQVKYDRDGRPILTRAEMRKAIGDSFHKNVPQGTGDQKGGDRK